MIKRIVALSFFSMVSCAAHYSRPAAPSRPLTTNVDFPRDKVYSAVAYVLRTSGYRIGFSNKARGRIGTVPKKTRLSRSECDCGAVMGRRFITDPNTTTHVSVTAIVKDGAFTIQATISGTNSSSEESQHRTLYCESRGSIEKHLAGRVKAFLSQNRD